MENSTEKTAMMGSATAVTGGTSEIGAPDSAQDKCEHSFVLGKTSTLPNTASNTSTNGSTMDETIVLDDSLSPEGVTALDNDAADVSYPGETFDDNGLAAADGLDPDNNSSTKNGFSAADSSPDTTGAFDASSLVAAEGEVASGNTGPLTRKDASPESIAATPGRHGSESSDQDISELDETDTPSPRHFNPGSMRVLAKKLAGETSGDSIGSAPAKTSSVSNGDHAGNVDDSESDMFEPESDDDIEDLDEELKGNAVAMKEVKSLSTKSNKSARPKQLDLTGSSPPFSSLGGPPKIILHQRLHVLLKRSRKLEVLDMKALLECVGDCQIFVRVYRNEVFFIAQETTDGQKDLLNWFYKNAGSDFVSSEGDVITLTALELRNEAVAKVNKFDDGATDGSDIMGTFSIILEHRAHVLIPKDVLPLKQAATAILKAQIRDDHNYYDTLMLRTCRAGHLLVAKSTAESTKQLIRWLKKNDGKQVSDGNGPKYTLTKISAFNLNPTFASMLEREDMFRTPKPSGNTTSTPRGLSEDEATQKVVEVPDQISNKEVDSTSVESSQQELNGGHEGRKIVKFAFSGKTSSGKTSSVNAVQNPLYVKPSVLGGEHAGKSTSTSGVAKASGNVTSVGSKKRKSLEDFEIQGEGSGRNKRRENKH